MIRNIQGKILDIIDFKEQSLTVDTSKFAKGILLVTFVTEDLVQTKKIINK